MPKLQIQVADDLSSGKRGFKALKIASIFILALLAVPVFWECATLGVSQWSEVISRPMVVKTPILDRIQARAQAVREDIADFLESHSSDFRWDVEIVFPVLALVMVIAMVVLRH